MAVATMTHQGRTYVNLHTSKLDKDSKTMEWGWDDLYTVMDSYIKFAATKVCTSSHGGQTDIRFDTEDLVQEGRLRLYHVFTKLHDGTNASKMFNEAVAIAKTSVWRKLWELVGVHTMETEELTELNTESMSMASPLFTDELDDEAEANERLQEVARLLSAHPIALTILREFLHPSTRTRYVIEQECNEAQEQSRTNKRVRVPQTLKLSQRHIRMAMGLGETQFANNMRLVRQAMTIVYKEKIFGADPL